ncbi:hypothetical protein F5X97DRAFT_296445, partial [Nemania serpens]
MEASVCVLLFFSISRVSTYLHMLLDDAPVRSDLPDHRSWVVGVFRIDTTLKGSPTAQIKTRTYYFFVSHINIPR